jgi:hypothetical protein
MRELTPCPGCQRHVRKTETSCPFCAQALALADLPAPVLPRSRLGRAATFAFGATLAGATALVACGGESEGKKESAGGSASSGSASGGAGAGQSPGGTGIAPPYGLPAAGSENDTGGTPSGFGGGLVYGSPPAGSDGLGLAGIPPK